MFDWNLIPEGKRHIRRVMLGAGNEGLPDFINLDFFQSDKIDYKQDLRLPLPFDDNSIQEFHSNHVIEHFNYFEALNIFREVFRCLDHGGRFYSTLPDIQNVARQLATAPLGARRDSLLNCVYGGHAFGWQPSDAHKHHFGWSKESILLELKRVGFQTVRCDCIGSNSDIPIIQFEMIKPCA